jgi:dTDP-L-rhamnose 4-epimerase
VKSIEYTCNRRCWIHRVAHNGCFIKDGHDIKILDNLQKPVHLKEKPDHIPRKTEFIFGDVRDAIVLEYSLEGVDVVYHFAAYQDYLPDFSTYFHVNSVSTAFLYEIIIGKKLPIKKVIVASSKAVLGEGIYELHQL